MQQLTKLSGQLSQALASRPEGLRRLAEGALIAVLTLQAGRMVWLFLEPPADVPAGASMPAPDMSGLSRLNPFAPGSSGTAAIEADSSGYGLFGISADGLGGGSAIIGLQDGTQVSVAVGEALPDGAVLQSVDVSHVTLAIGPRRVRVEFASPDLGSDGAGTATAAPEEAAAEPAEDTVAVVDPARLVAEAGLRPKLEGMTMKGLVVSARGESPQLDAAGLQDGDVILSINGTALTSPQALNTLRQRLRSASSAEISYERDGQRRMTTVRTG